MLTLAYEKTYITLCQGRESSPVTAHQSLFILIDLRSNLNAEQKKWSDANKYFQPFVFVFKLVHSSLHRIHFVKIGL